MSAGHRSVKESTRPEVMRATAYEQFGSCPRSLSPELSNSFLCSLAVPCTFYVYDLDHTVFIPDSLFPRQELCLIG